MGGGRKVLGTNEVERDSGAVLSQVLQQTAETEQVIGARGIAQGRVVLTQAAQPAQQMGVTAQLGELAKVGKGSTQISQEMASHTAIVVQGAGPQGGGQEAEVAVEDLLQVGDTAHAISGEDKGRRWATARVYSRQTSWGASCT